MELRGVEESEVEIAIDGQYLKVAHAAFAEDILLPSPVNPATMERRYQNGILEVRLGKN